MFVGGKIKAKEIIKQRIINKNVSFFPNLPVACIIVFNYNKNLWQK